MINRLQLGPVVGHTDDVSARVWIQAHDDPGRYQLRVQGAGLFPFVTTETGPQEFHTGIATAVGLRSDWQYRYSVLRYGRLIPGAGGSFRTTPPVSSTANILFCAISCSSAARDGVWEAFARYVEDSLPHFVVMMGDQVYLDEDEPDVFTGHFKSSSSVRRRAMAEKYRLNWSREPVRRVLANVPTYMMWDDHDNLDGWGSSPGGSPTLVSKHPLGAEIFRKSTAFFEDARDVFWHFQGCHNPRPDDVVVDPALPNYIREPIPSGQRRAMPFAFRCGRLVVLVLDSRGDRDAFREQLPILGAEQWAFIEHVFDNLAPDVEALAVVTPTPIASVDPEGSIMKLMGERTDDVELFKRGDLEGLLDLDATSSESYGDLAWAALGARLTRLSGTPVNLGSFKVSAIDEARDQWSHKFSRPEQADLLRKTGRARLSNRTSGSARNVIFLSGDIHTGCIFDISVREPAYTAASLTSSGISNIEDRTLVVGTLIDEDFAVAPGIHSTVREVVPDFNFGVVQVIPTGMGATINEALAHKGNAFAVGLDVADLL